MDVHAFHSKRYLLFAALCLLLLTACSSSDNSSETTSFSAPLGSSIKNVQLTTGVPAEIKFTYTFPGNITEKGSATINLAETLSKVTLSSSPITERSNRFESFRLVAYALVKEAVAATSSAQVIAYISTAGDPNVCSSAYRYGPFTISGMIDAAVTSDTSMVAPTAPTIDIVNAGSFEICLVTIPPIDAFVTITDIVVDFDDCAVSTLEVEGNWSGTYSCENFGVANDPPGTFISLDIMKQADGSYRYIDDGSAEYEGHLCGNTFKFKGGLAGIFNESGTLRFASSTQASKTSNWLSVTPGSGGTCIDSLTKN